MTPLCLLAQKTSTQNLKKPESDSFAAQQTCPSYKPLEDMCTLISGRAYDPNPIGFNKYMYQRKIMEAACVVDEPDKEKQAEKISKMWEKYSDRLTCQNGQFNVVNGSIIKYAISEKFDVFIHNVIAWKVNLNTVDKADGRTVLDYVADEMKRNKGNPLEFKLKNYFDELREEGGAKFAFELKSSPK